MPSPLWPSWTWKRPPPSGPSSMPSRPLPIWRSCARALSPEPITRSWCGSTVACSWGRGICPRRRGGRCTPTTNASSSARPRSPCALGCAPAASSAPPTSARPRTTSGSCWPCCRSWPLSDPSWWTTFCATICLLGRRTIWIRWRRPRPIPSTRGSRA